jgi:dihydrofolate synthase/folylpolyglutamate synthase
VAAASGRRTGLHTSPHLFHLAERLRLDGVPAPEAWIAGAVARYRAAFDALQPSFFEATTALSFLYFAEQQVDLAVVETGLGGRLDATNVLRPRLAIITHIGLEHTALLGETRGEIAREKAGIIKPGVPVLDGAGSAEASDVIHSTALERGAPYHAVREEVAVHQAVSSLDGLTLTMRTPLRTYDALHVGLPGIHQRTNAVLAVHAAELLFEDLAQNADPVYEGLRDVRRLAGLRGRLEVLRRTPLVVADVAHTPDSLAAALAFVEAQWPAGRRYVLFGLMRDKDAAAMARLLAGTEAQVFVVGGSSPRALPSDDLATMLRAQGVSVAGCGSAAEGWTWFQQEATDTAALLITGSHQVVAAFPLFDANSG